MKSRPRLGCGPLTGFNLFVKINVRLANRRRPQVDLPPPSLTRPSARKGTEASAVRVRGRATTSYNWQRLRDFHRLIRQRKWSRGTTIPRDTDITSIRVWPAAVLNLKSRAVGVRLYALPSNET
jgi:hypothetical protein